MSKKNRGRLIGIGVGPGDPELITLKGLARLRAADLVAYPILADKPAFTRKIIAQYLTEQQHELPLSIPLAPPQRTAKGYDQAARQLADKMTDGHQIALLCEGDPFFYGSFARLYERLVHRWPIEVIPGVSSIMAAAATTGQALAQAGAPFSVLPGLAPIEDIRKMLKSGGNFAIIKPSQKWPQLLDLFDELKLLKKATLIIHATLENQQIHHLDESRPQSVPYFSLVLISGDAHGAA